MDELTTGQDPVSGKFLRGNKIARGNAVPRKTATFRAQLFRCVSPSDFRAVVAALVEQAKDGQPWAIRECLRYLVGNAQDVELSERIVMLERTIKQER